MTIDRVGQGWDRHRLVAGRTMVLAGITIPGEIGPLAHSDGDAAIHAVIDAILGAAGMGDIGELFPDTDPRWQDADSADLLAEVVQRIRQSGFAIENVDVTIMLQRPRLSDHKAAMRAKLAELLGCPIEQVSVKAKSGEGLGPVGSGEAVEASAVAGLSRGRAT